MQGMDFGLHPFGGDVPENLNACRVKAVIICQVKASIPIIVLISENAGEPKRAKAK